MSTIDLTRLNKPAPRYTSYPTAPNWGPIAGDDYITKLQGLTAPLSLYFHIPFCKTMCLYCGCSVVLNRKSENEERYVTYLCREIEMISRYLPSPQKVVQIHFGGGTPTQLSMPLFEKIFKTLNQGFAIDYDQEIAIEIDPRTVVEDGGEKLTFLRKLGFNRVSFGVQDTDPKVQQAVHRRQSLETTLQTYFQARSLGFKGINIDLIYGLPFQTVESFTRTVDHIVQMSPDRISLFSYAKVPWLKPHQKAIKEETLPSTEEKFRIYALARDSFVRHGYQAIGMDHFARQEDELAQAYHNKKLQRNFQGYSLKLADDLIGLGVTSIGFLQGMYTQNVKELKRYYDLIDQATLPLERGKILTEEDHLRKWVIHTLMCDFEIDKRLFHRRFQVDFDIYFEQEWARLAPYKQDGLVSNKADKLLVTPQGELFIRLIAMCFDAYLTTPSPQPQFSQSI